MKSNTGIKQTRGPVEGGATRPPRDPVAVVGIGCRFPGGITGPESFWRLLQDGVDAITEIPADRMDVAAYYDPRPAVPGKMMTRWGGFLEHIDKFDAGFFGISPREAERLDPQQRLLLEVAWEALEDAGQRIDDLAGSATGVFVGMWLNDYEGRLFANPAGVDFYMTTGTGRYSASGRLSYFLGLQGPSLTVDTACSSSLVAVHLACQSLWRNECSLALAGGANVILQPHISIAYSQSKMMAPDGRCKFGDASANGYVRSEGAGIVILKPLSAAFRDGDPIYALICGTAVNNDGRSSGYMTTPAREGQEQLLRRAYSDAGISPGDVQYVEAHGTGTLAGDPVELSALGTVLSSDRPRGSQCYVGSVKTNFGHTEGAAGIAGLIKTALILKHRSIPASLHLKELNPNIAWKEFPLVIPRQLMPWPLDSGTALAGVSAFGIAGTNAHVVLSESIGEPAGSATRLSADSPCLLPLSARSPEALSALAREYHAPADDQQAPSLYDMCFTVALRRAHHEHRMAVAVRSRRDLKQSLEAFLRGESSPGLCTGRAESEQRHKVVFVCPGQGSQWVGMGRQLIAEQPVFCKVLQQCERAMRPLVDWSLQEQLNLSPGAPAYRLNDIDVIQPTLLAIEIALAALWRSWGVEPDAVVGHSMGEVAAAFVAGALSLEDAMRIICARSLLLRRVSGKGAMAVVALPMAEAKLAITGFEDRVSVAVSNSPRSTVLSGDPAAVAQMLESLQARNIFCRLVKVDVASHSPQMEPLTADLLRAVEGIRPREAAVPIYSTVSANTIDGASLDGRYWMRNLRSTVRFAETVQRLAEDEHTIFIELSPHPVLMPSVEETLHDIGHQGYAISSLERDKDEHVTLLASVGRLFTIGYRLEWTRFFPSEGKVVSLPAYPWQRQRFWMDTQSEQRSSSFRGVAGNTIQDHPLLGVRLPQVASLPGSFIWQNRLDTRFRNRLREGHANDSNLLPGTIYLEMASAAATEVFGKKLHRVSDLNVHLPVALPEDAEPEMQFVLASAESGSASFQIFTRESEAKDEWTLCVSGKLEAGRAEADCLYELEWKPKPLLRGGAKVSAEQPGQWLIFTDRGGLGAAVAAEMETRGEKCTLVCAGEPTRVQNASHFSVSSVRPEELRRITDQVMGSDSTSCRGVVYFWSLDAPTLASHTATSLQTSQAFTCDGVLHVTKALAQRKSKITPRLWLVTAGAQAVEPADGNSLSVEQAPVWGLGRTIALEHPELWGGLIDLPQSNKTRISQTQLAKALCDEILGSDGEDQVALRDDRRYVVRLVRSEVAAVEGGRVTVLADASYLITGGLGALGFHLADWLIRRGARHLVLTSRAGLPERSTWAAVPAESDMGRRIARVRALEERGARIHIAKADVGDESQMSKLWDEFGRDHPPLRGIIHAAGTLSAHDLADLTADEMHEVLRSKVAGAWLLHQFAQRKQERGEALDFFVLFSSGASVWGSQKLAHYAAGNHFLDALAHYRRAIGQPALSVNWGWWEGAGLVSDELATVFGRIGLKPIPAEQALAALEYLLETGATQKTVADVDWNVFGPVFEAKKRRPLLEQILIQPQVQRGSPKSEEAKRPGLLVEIQQASALEKKPLLHRYIRAQVAEILGFASADGVDPKQGFFKMGMDSIMTVQLRNRLEASLNCTLPPTVAFEYPTVDALTQFVAETVIKTEKSMTAAAGVQPTATKTRIPEIQHQPRSEEELVALLAKKLEQLR